MNKEMLKLFDYSQNRGKTSSNKFKQRIIQKQFQIELQSY